MSEMLKKLIEGYELIKEDHTNSTSITAFLDQQIKMCEEMIENSKFEEISKRGKT